jgi:branched-chain amino acid transport system substrate-binding protein
MMQGGYFMSISQQNRLFKHGIAKSLAVVALAAISLTACSAQSPSATKSASSTSSTPISIGEIDSLTGISAQFGVPQHQAIELAVKKINDAGGLTVGGKKYTLELTALDDETTPATGALDMQKLLGQGIHLFVGSLSSATVGAYLPLVKARTDVINIVTGAAVTGITQYPSMYSARATILEYETGQVAEVKKLAPPKSAPHVVYLYDQTNASAVAEEPKVKQDLTALGYKLDEIQYSAGATQFGTQITSIKNANASAVLVTGSASDAANFIKQSRQLGYTGPVITAVGLSATSVTGASLSVTDMQGVYDVQAATATDVAASGGSTTKYDSFASAYQAAYGAAPGFTSADSYDGVYILAKAIEKAGSPTKYSAIRSAMDSMKATDVPELVQSIVPQSPGSTLFRKHQAYFKIVAHKWNGTAFVFDGYLG